MSLSSPPPTSPPATPAPEVAVRSVGKWYGGRPVLQDVTVAIRPGEVHCLVGENGAGKSTLLKILAGAVPADEGELLFDGRPVVITEPRDAIALGVGLISQEGALLPSRSVLDNVFLGRWSHRWSALRPRADLEHFAELAELTRFSIDPGERAGNLPLGVQQQVEILRALARGTRVLALDEPTAVLTEHDKVNLLQLIRDLAAGGTTVVLVSHFLDEVLSVADRVTVLRDGRLVTTGPAGEYTAGSLVRHMVGREVELLSPDVPDLPEHAPVVLAARGLGRGGVGGIDLDVRAGEILGVAGLVGSGRTEVLRLLFGADRRTSGVVSLDGAVLGNVAPHQAIRRGLALVPESRKDQGLMVGRSVRENVALASLDQRRFGPFVRTGRERSAVGSVVERVDLRGGGPETAVTTLSGGNQQKALFAKWLLCQPRVLLVDEPTRGVDVAAKAQIHRLITDLARSGAAVVCVSSEIEELLALSHRVIVLRQGRQVAAFARGTAREVVIAAAFGDAADEGART